MALVHATGCFATGPSPSRREIELEACVRPLLEMHPDANWTASYNRLLEFGPQAIDYVASQPAMRQPAAPDDLRVMLCTSLLRLLADPRSAPPLSVNCFETTLNVLHLDPKVRGHRLGTVCLPDLRVSAWHELYPANFDHELASEIDLEADRRAMLRWWRSRQNVSDALPTRPALQPNPQHLWPVLRRRYADVWTYEPRGKTVLCSTSPNDSALLRSTTYDYNLVRAVTIWLGTCDAPGVRSELIELVAHPCPVVAHNARFALRHSPDPGIRKAIEKFHEPPPASVPAMPDNIVVTIGLESAPERFAIPPLGCGDRLSKY